MIDERQGPVTGGLPIQAHVPVQLRHGVLDGLEMMIERGEDGRPPAERYFVGPYGDARYALACKFAVNGVYVYTPVAA